MKLQVLSVSEGKEKKKVPGFKVVNTFQKSLTFIHSVGGRVLRWLKIPAPVVYTLCDTYTQCRWMRPMNVRRCHSQTVLHLYETLSWQTRERFSCWLRGKLLCCDGHLARTWGWPLAYSQQKTENGDFSPTAIRNSVTILNGPGRGPWASGESTVLPAPWLWPCKTPSREQLRVWSPDPWKRCADICVALSH